MSISELPLFSLQPAAPKPNTNSTLGLHVPVEVQAQEVQKTNGFNPVPAPLFEDSESASVGLIARKREVEYPKQQEVKPMFHSEQDPSAGIPARPNNVTRQVEPVRVVSAPVQPKSESDYGVVPAAILKSAQERRDEKPEPNPVPTFLHDIERNQKPIEGNAFVPAGGNILIKPGTLPVRPAVISGGLSEQGQQQPAPVESNSPYKQGTTPLGTPTRPGNQGS